MRKFKKPAKWVSFRRAHDAHFQKQHRLARLYNFLDAMKLEHAVRTIRDTSIDHSSVTGETEMSRAFSLDKRGGNNYVLDEDDETPDSQDLKYDK